jgi:hypothetical protein
MCTKRYVTPPPMSRLATRDCSRISRWKSVFKQICFWALFVMCCCMMVHCGGNTCEPSCPNGYTCQFGQCILDADGGKVQSIRCEDYCARLVTCNRSQLAKCQQNQCSIALTQLPTAERTFRLRFYECHMAATCAQIGDYLDLQSGFLRTCIGCVQDSHCPGGYRCNVGNRLCLNECKSDTDCRGTHTCVNNRCEAR